MVWDKNQTLGSIPRNLFDDRVRDNNDAIETAINAEHYFATAGAQHGRHKFGVGTNVARNAIANITTGGLWISTDEVAGENLLQARFQDTGVPADDWTTVATELLGIRNLWTEMQESLYFAIGSSAVPTPDLADSDAFTIQGDQNIVIQNPLNLPVAGRCASFTLEVIVSGAGSWTLGFTAAYRFPNGQEPTQTSATGKVDRFNCIVDSTGVFVDTFPAMNL